MPRFGKKSKEQLATCNEKLERVFNEVIKTVDCSVLEGHRGKVRQDAFYEEGKTKVKYPKGRHNANPSLAVDVVPYPIDWDDRERFHLFAGFVLGTAKQMGIKENPEQEDKGTSWYDAVRYGSYLHTWYG